MKTPPTPPGQPNIDLAQWGQLIAPVQVDGDNWYYYWDRSDDGTSANTGNLNGGVDYVNHDFLDTLFKYDVNGNPNLGVDTNDTYRYATLNGVKLALPTANGGAVYPNGVTNYQPGTAVDNSPNGEVNVQYNDLLAVWDGHNGSTTATDSSIVGVPSGWQSLSYWSATPSSKGHVSINLGNSYLYDNLDTYGNDYVALQVLS